MLNEDESKLSIIVPNPAALVNFLFDATSFSFLGLNDAVHDEVTLIPLLLGLGRT